MFGFEWWQTIAAAIVLLISFYAGSIWILRTRLTNINANSWHFKITEDVWGNNAYGKACPYWWYKMPSAIPTHYFRVALKGALIAFVMLCFAVGAFVGFMTKFHRYPDGGWSFESCDYKVWPSGNKMLLAPWEIALGVATATAYLYIWLADASDGIKVTLFAAVAFPIILLVLIARRKFWGMLEDPDKRERFFTPLRALTGKCPELQVINSPSTE